MLSSTRVFTSATVFLLATLLGGEVAIAAEVIKSDDCLEAMYHKGKAELIIIPAQGQGARLRQVLVEAKLKCVAQLQLNGACLVQIDPWQEQSIESIAELLRNNIFALRGGSAPKGTQDAVGKVIVNLDFKKEGIEKNKFNKAHVPPSNYLVDPQLDGQAELRSLDAHISWIGAQKTDDVLTAIVDTGVKLDHEDLAGQFVPGTTIGCKKQSCDGTPDPDNENVDHGTRVAGILAAAKGNLFGGVGVAWNTRFMSINYGPVVDQYRMSCALQFAIEHHADIINASWTGGNEPGEYDSQPWDVFKEYALLARDQGMLIVFAAGNGGVNIDIAPWYPLNLRLPNMLVVTAYNIKKDEMRPTSNFGRETTDIAAPDFASATTCIESTHCYTPSESPGTSWSAAYVSGAAALLKSHSPNTNYDFLKWRILANATPEAMLSGVNKSGGRLNLAGTIFPINASHGVLSRTKDSPINWSKGIRSDMCTTVSIEGRPVKGNNPDHYDMGNYFPIVASTPNDGLENLPHDKIAHVTEDKLQLLIRCIDASPVAESLPLPLN